MIRSNPHTQQLFPPAGQITLGDYIKQKQKAIDMKSVFIVDGGMAYHLLFKKLGFNIVDSLTKADLVCFTGGADVTPSLYGDLKHPLTGNDPFRDSVEKEIFSYCSKNSIPMVGICRGGQFLNVMSGGRMYQHVSKHTDPHFITDLQEGVEVFVSSTHHQMMMPSNQATIIASASLGGFREWYDGEVFRRDVSDQDFEVVYYKHTNCLCFQPHPEFERPEYEEMQTYFSKLIQQYLFS